MKQDEIQEMTTKIQTLLEKFEGTLSQSDRDTWAWMEKLLSHHTELEREIEILKLRATYLEGKLSQTFVDHHIGAQHS